MKVQNSKRINERIVQIMEVRNSSAIVNAVISNAIHNMDVIPEDKELLRRAAEQVRDEMKHSGRLSLSIEETMFMLVLELMLKQYLESQPKLMDYYINLLMHESKVFKKEDFEDNPYLKNIKFNNQLRGDFELREDSFKPFEIDIYNISKHTPDTHIEIPRLSCFAEEFRFPAIYQKSKEMVWMSVTPNEIFTMEKPLARAKGKVLTLGLGMGYFAYMAAIKDEVESVTVIEREQAVIDLFNEYILPQFEYTDKISIIKGDAIEYIGQIDDGLYDYCFADIWAGVNDINPYLELKAVAKRMRKTKMEYWIEEGFANRISNLVYLEILKGFYEATGIPMPDINGVDASEDEKKLQKFVTEMLDKADITKAEHIDYYLDPRTIAGMI